MTTAGALLTRSTELQLFKLLRKSRNILHPGQFPQSHCEDEFSSKTCVLLASETALESEVREALRIRQRDGDSTLSLYANVFGPCVTSRFFWWLWTYWTSSYTVFSTWYTSCHLPHLGHAPLRSRSSPFGLSTLNPAETEKTNAANRGMEISAWVAEQTLHCPSKVIGLKIIFPEAVGGTFHVAPLRCGRCGSFNSWKRHVMLAVQLVTCASSRASESDDLQRTLPWPPSFGNSASTTTHWKRRLGSLRDGDRS